MDATATAATPETPKKKKGWGSFIVIVLVCGLLYYLYNIKTEVVEEPVKADTTAVAVPVVATPTVAVAIDTTTKAK